MAAGERAFHEVEINGLKRQLPLFPVGDHLDIAVFNILGDTEVVEAAAAGLADRIPLDDVDALVMAETKSVPLAYELARQVGKPWVGCGRPTSRTWAR
jgi:adenine phosphoribosyltransferase